MNVEVCLEKQKGIHGFFTFGLGSASLIGTKISIVRVRPWGSSLNQDFGKHLFRKYLMVLKAYLYMEFHTGIVGARMNPFKVQRWILDFITSLSIFLVIKWFIFILSMILLHLCKCCYYWAFTAEILSVVFKFVFRFGLMKLRFCIFLNSERYLTPKL